MNYEKDIFGAFFSIIVTIIFWKILIVPGGSFIAILIGIVCLFIYRYLTEEKEIYNFPNIKFKKYFVCLLILSLLSVLLISNVNNTIEFIAWNKLPTINLIRLILGSLLAIFFPGFIILSLIDKRKLYKGLEKTFSSILISLLILPFFGILIFALGSNIQKDGTSVIILLNSILLIAYLLKKENHESVEKVSINLNEKLILFFLLLIISSVYVFSKYSLNLTWDYGDLNGYFGWALSFTKNDLPLSIIGPGSEYPFWLFIFLAEGFSVSGVPYVNAFQFMLILLSFLPILSFYIMISGFFKESRNRKIPIIATMLGFFGGGFGWIYSRNLLGNSQTVQGLYNLFKIAANTDSGYLALPIHPLYTVIPYYITLATIFALIWLVYSKCAFSSGNVNYILVSVIVALGYLLYKSLTVIFILIFLVSIFIFKRENLSIYRRYAASIIFGLILVALVDIIMGGSFYTYGDSFTQYGFSLFYGALSLAALGFFLSFIKSRLPTPNGLIKISQKRVRIFKVVISCLVIYFYFLCFLIVSKVVETYGHLPNDVHDVPWYAWPVRLGISGLIALPAVIYLINRGKRAKEYLFFIFLVPVSFVIGRILHVYPFYFEDRLMFFVMIPISILASYALFNLNEKLKMKLKANGKNMVVGIIISTIVILGFLPPLLVEEAIDYGYWSNGKNLSNFELAAFNFLRLNTPSNYSVLTLTARSNYLLPYAGLSDMQARINRDPSIIFNPFFAETALYSLMKAQVKYIYLTPEDKMQLENSNDFSGFVKDYLLKYLPIAYQNDEVTIYEIPDFSIPTSSNTTLVTSNLKTGYYQDTFDESYDKYCHYSSVLTTGDIITVKTDNSSDNHDFELPVNTNPNEYPYVLIRWKTDGAELNFYLIGVKTVYFVSLGVSTSWKTTVIDLHHFYDFVKKTVIEVEPNEQISSVLFRNFKPNSEYSIDSIQFAGFSNNDSVSEFLPLNMVAFSQNEYSTVLDNDPARFNASTLILTHDLNQWNEAEKQGFQRYLDWVNRGGRLVVLESSGTMPSYESKSWTINDYIGWRDENFTTGWTPYECFALCNNSIVTIKTNDNENYHDFYSNAISVAVGSYPYVVIRWKTDGSNLFFYPRGTKSGFRYIDLGASTEWTTSTINLKEFYGNVPQNITSFIDDEQIDKLLFRSFSQNATYWIDDVEFYKGYPLPINPCFTNLLSLYTENTCETNGIESQTGALNFPSMIKVPVIHSNDLGTKIIANYTVNKLPVSPYALTKTIGKGELIYLAVSPYFSAIENSSDDVKRGLFREIGSLLNVLDLKLSKNVVKWTNYFPQFDFIETPMNLTGKVSIDTNYVQLQKLNISNIFVLSGDGTRKTISLNNAVIDEFDYTYPVKFKLNASEVHLSIMSLGRYQNLEVEGDFNLTMEIPRNTIVKMSIRAGSALLNETFKESTIQFSVKNNYKTFVLVKNPTITTDGNAHFNKARIFRNYYKMPLFYNDGSNPFEVTGNTTFYIEYSDNGVIFVSNFTFDGNWFYPTNEQKQKPFTEMDIPWFSVLTSFFHILLVTMICTFLIILMLPRLTLKSKN